MGNVFCHFPLSLDAMPSMDQPIYSRLCMVIRCSLFRETRCYKEARKSRRPAPQTDSWSYKLCWRWGTSLQRLRKVRQLNYIQLTPLFLQNGQGHLSRDMTKPTKWVCAQSDQRLRCPHEESLGPYLPIKRTAKTLMRLSGFVGFVMSRLICHSGGVFFYSMPELE